jgi:pimeloyl-ACP methyl ester carboxylesterase
VEAIADDEGQGLLYDLPGHGLHAHTGVEMTFGRHVAGSVDPSKPVVLCAESLGCGYVLEVRDALADRGVASASIVLFAPPLLLNVRRLLQWAVETLRRSPRSVLHNRFSLEVPFRETQEPQTLESWRRDPKVKKEVDVQYLLRCLGRVLRVWPDLTKLDEPTLLVQGERDPLLIPANLSVANRISGAQVRRTRHIPHGGHSLLWGKAAPAATAEARLWIQEVLKDTPRRLGP